MENKDGSITQIIKSSLSGCLSGLNLRIHIDIYQAIVEHIEFYLAIEYLKLHDWNKKISISQLAVMLYKDGKYYQKHNQYKNREFSVDFLRQGTNLLEQNTVNEFEYLCKKMLKYHRNMNSEKRNTSIINRDRDSFAQDKDKLRKERFSRGVLKYYELVEFISIFCLHADEELKQLKSTYWQFLGNKIHLMQYPQYEDLVLYFKQSIDCEAANENIATLPPSVFKEIALLLKRIAEWKTTVNSIITAPLFKYYSYYLIEQQYKLETIKTIAGQLRNFKRNSEKDKRELFLADVMSIICLPLFKIRDEYIESYINYYKINSLDSWREEVKVISNLIPMTFHITKNKIAARDNNEQIRLYENLVCSLNQAIKISGYRPSASNLQCGEDFKQVDIKDIFGSLHKHTVVMREKIMSALDEALLDEEVMDEFARAFVQASYDFPGCEFEDILAHNYSETFTALYKKVSEIAHRDKLL